MAFVPENDLEHALVRASKEAAARPAFYRLLLESDLYVIGEVEGTPAGEGQRSIAAGERIQIASGESKGRQFLPVFSALVRMQTYLREERKYLSLKGRALFEMTKGALLILNPGSDYGKELLPDEIAGLLNPSVRSVTLDKPTKVLIGQPAVYPHDLINALKTAFAQRPDVSSAYLIQIAFDGEAPHPLIGVETTGDWPGVSQEIGRAVAAVAPGLRVDAVQIDRAKPDGFAASLLNTAPFYTRPTSTV